MQSEKRQGADLGPQGPLFIHDGGTIGNTLSLLIPLRAGAASQAVILCLATRVFELLLPLPLVAMEAASEKSCLPIVKASLSEAVSEHLPLSAQGSTHPEGAG